MRSHATVWAETIDQSDIQSFSGQMGLVDKEALWIDVSSTQPDLSNLLPGQYYQLIISLDESRYLTVTDLLDVQGTDAGSALVFTRPKGLQVMQRRRFVRCMPGHSHPVHLSWRSVGQDKPTVVLAQISDLSLHGISVRVADAHDSSLFIGDTINVRFTLSVREPEFCTGAIICHKELTKESSELTVGLQFATSDEDDLFQSRLRVALMRDGSLKKGI